MMRKFFFVVFIILGTSVSLSQETRPQVEPRRGMVGIQLQEKEGQFYVFRVFKNSPAEKAGLKDGDLILRVNGRDAAGLTLPEVLNQFNGDPDSLVDVAVRRGDEELPPVSINRVSPKDLMESSVDYQRLQTQGTRPERTPVESTPAPPEESTPTVSQEKIKAWLIYLEKVYGLRVIPIDGKFGEKLGALFTEGLLVLEVQVGKPAYKAGLEKWDLIYRIENKPPLELFRTQTPPPEASGDLPLNLTLMGLTGEKPIKM